MKINVKKLEDGNLELVGVASVDDVARSFKAATYAFAQRMGLRPDGDKSFEQVAKERLGIQNLDSVIEQQAMEDIVPYALDKKNIIPAFPPEIVPASPFKRGKEFRFVLNVMPKPEYELSSYEPVEITVETLKVSEREVEIKLEEIADRYSDYVKTDDKAIEPGDSALISLECYNNGEYMKGISTTGRTYTAGEGYMPEGFDEGVIGMKPGETKSFSFEAPDIDDEGNECKITVDCTVEVKEIQVKQAAQFSDEWVKTHLPMFDSYQAFRDSIEDEVRKASEEQYTDYKRQLCSSELAKRVNAKIPDEVYEAQRNSIMQNLRAQLAQSDISFDSFVEQQGGAQQFNMMMMLQVRQTLLEGFALDALFRHEGLVLTDEDIEEVCRQMNPQVQPKRLRQEMESTGRGFVLRESAERLKASNYLLEHAVINYRDQVQNQAAE